MAIRLSALALLLTVFAGCRDILSPAREGFADREPAREPDTVEIDTAWLFGAVRDHLQGAGLEDSLASWILSADSTEWEEEWRTDSAESG